MMTGSVQPQTPANEQEEDLVDFLEPDQLAVGRSRPVSRYPLTPHASFWLWVLRVFVLVVSAMVIYTFFVQLS
jgi:hypothetical protein